jgi:hypothetical protein
MALDLPFLSQHNNKLMARCLKRETKINVLNGFKAGTKASIMLIIDPNPTTFILKSMTIRRANKGIRAAENTAVV